MSYMHNGKFDLFVIYLCQQILLVKRIENLDDNRRSDWYSKMTDERIDFLETLSGKFSESDFIDDQLDYDISLYGPLKNEALEHLKSQIIFTSQKIIDFFQTDPLYSGVKYTEDGNDDPLYTVANAACHYYINNYYLNYDEYGKKKNLIKRRLLGPMFTGRTLNQNHVTKSQRSADAVIRIKFSLQQIRHHSKLESLIYQSEIGKI